MSTETKDLQYDSNDITGFSKERQEPQWFTDIRLKGLELTGQLPMPKPEKTRIIGWNFTQFEHKADSRTFDSLEDLPVHIKQLVGQDDESGNVLIQHNGHGAYQVLSEELKAKGVIFTDLQTALKEHGDLVEKYYFSKAGKIDKHRLTALHAALVNSGTFLYIPKNVVIDVPLQTVYWQENPKVGFINHVIVVAEEGSSVTYVENYLSEEADGEGVANIISEVYVGDNAQVQFGAVDNFSKNVTVYVNRQGHVGRNGKLEWALGQMNDGNTISENLTELVGEASIADTKAVSVGRGDQKQSFVNNNQHYGKHSESMMLIHGVQKDSANSIFNGITKIEHGGTKSSGDQTQRVLMLSDKARGDANPILLIDEDDVIAGHAASVGRIDPVQLYYLMSRGISKKEAERLVIHGFLAPVVNQLPIEGVKKQLVEVIERKVQ
ncbi:Fe-S cluster assembly protein SufD [Scopulibacillus darangshiensis]|uniref:Fe-S cluster assembly protein SufD n=1 Tax=Scopulibacillus darangshiensis TaxID=442528 RepID=A0A4R2NP03_9BACL|nr:Fe-S cluster assembly protein SufD [Scopulibacillus darangshiensis]TCP23513.1 Fe-S cluster assembly protein SufD [Scopulibacillus darangshiensis]